MPLIDPHPHTNAMAPDVQRDDELGAQLEAQVHEAADRETFHRIEAERWRRVGRAAAAGLNELRAVEPVGQVTPSDYLDQAEQAPPVVHGPRPGGTYS